MTAIKLGLGVVAVGGWHVHQMDINNAFLYGDLVAEVYIYPPLGYAVPKGHVCKLSISLYGFSGMQN